MPCYEFTLRLDIARTGLTADECTEALGAAGCTDAVVGIGLSGRIALCFEREAENARQAVDGVVRACLAAMPGAVITEALPDYVGLTDVARVAGFSRQNMRQLIQCSDDAPFPVHEGRPSLWHLADLLAWLARRGYNVDALTGELAEELKQLNIAVACQVADGQAQERIRAIVA